jgi:surface carbohydrate biosynthesis protein
VDNPLRDLPGIALLGLELCARGHHALLVPVNILSDAWAGNPDFFVLNYHRNVNDYQIRRILGRGIGFAILDTEGSYPLLELYASILSQDTALRHKASAVCMWGSRLSDYLVKKEYYPRELLHVTGCPRHDYFHPALADAARKRSEDFLPSGEKFVLITNSSPVANPRLLSPKEEFEVFASMSSMDRSWCQAYAAEQKTVMENTIEIAGKLAADFPDANFVMRPHPFENPQPYTDVLGKYDNVNLIQQGAIDGFLLRACCAILRLGTTTLDAGLAGIPALSFHWVGVEYQYSEESDAILHHCSSYNALRTQVAAVLEGTYRTPPEIEASLDHALFQRFHKRDGRAHVRVADALEEALARWNPADKKGMTGLRMWGWASKLARKKAVASWKSSVKYFDADTVRGIVDGIQALPTAEFPELKVPIDLSFPKMPLDGAETFKCRAVLMRPER